MTGAEVDVDEAVAVAVAFMLLLPRVVVPPPPTRTVTELEVCVTMVWLCMAEEFPEMDEVTASRDVSPSSRVMVLP